MACQKLVKRLKATSKMLTTANKKPRWQGLIQAGLDNGIDLQARGRTNPPAGKSGPFQYVLTSHNRASCIFQVENLKPWILLLDYLKGGHPDREEKLVSFFISCIFWNDGSEDKVSFLLKVVLNQLLLFGLPDMCPLEQLSRKPKLMLSQV